MQTLFYFSSNYKIFDTFECQLSYEGDPFSFNILFHISSLKVCLINKCRNYLQELYSNPKFILDNNDTFDVVTGRLGKFLRPDN